MSAEGSHSGEVASEQDMNDRRHTPGVCLEERAPGTGKVRAEAAERSVLEPGITQRHLPPSLMLQGFSLHAD